MVNGAQKQRYDVAVVGAGQAGLAIGHFLARDGKRFVIFEAGGSIGAAWRTRWDSLVLFTARRYDALPAADFPGDPDGYPTRDEVIAYLDDYATRFGLPIELNSAVQSIYMRGRSFVLRLGGQEVEADQVVVATGPFQVPRFPDFAAQLAPHVFQTHSSGYTRPSDVPNGTVLVVGGGNTGFQIAGELSRTHRVCLSVGSRQLPLPQKPFRRDLFWWLTNTGLMRKSVESRLGQRLRYRDTLIGSTPRSLKRQGVELRPRATGATRRTVSFVDGTTLDVDAVIWASGYRLDHSWIDVPTFDETGDVRHRRGVTETPGLYFLGLPWQHTRGSALLGWVKDDAEYLAGRIETFQLS